MNATYGNDAKATWRQVCAILMAAWRVWNRAEAAVFCLLFLSSHWLLSLLSRSDVSWSIETLLYWHSVFFVCFPIPIYLFYTRVFFQMDPVLARTVPGFVRAQKWTVGVAITAVSCIAAVVATWLDGQPVYAAALAAGLSATLAPKACNRDVGIRYGLGAAALFTPYAIGQSLAPGLPVWPITVATAGLLVIRALRADAIVHREQWWADHQLKLQAFGDPEKHAGAKSVAPLDAWGFPSAFAQRNYGRLLDHTLATPQPLPSTLMTLGLGPRSHWATGLSIGLTELLLLLGLFALGSTAVLLGSSVGAFTAALLGSGVSSGFFMVTLVLNPLRVWMLTLQHEQALLRLVPGSPQGPALNRWFALYLGRWYVARHGIQLLVLLPVGCLSFPVLSRLWDYIHGIPLDPAWLWTLLTHAMILALVGGVVMLHKLTQLWRDWSARGTPFRLALDICVLLVVAVLVMVTSVAVEASPWTVLSLFSGSLAVLMSMLMIRRWKAMMRAPVAWPVGRR